MRTPRLPSLLAGIIVMALLLFYALTSSGSSSTTPTPVPPTAGAGGTSDPGSSLALGQRTKTSNCVPSNGLPDSACTPGAFFSNVTAGQVCQPGYSSQVRDVPESVKNQVYAEYGIASQSPGQYEVDHLISLELGGSNDISNLWPEPADPRPGFHEKDKVENYLHDQVCSGKMTLHDAQVQISTDWYSVYKTLP